VADPDRAQTDHGYVGWSTLLLAAAVLPQYLVGSLAVQMRDDFPFTDAQLGAAVGISFALSALISPVAGRTIESIGVRRGVTIAALSVAGSSLAMMFVDSAAAVLALMAVNGIGGGIGSPSLSSLLADRVARARHGTAFGLFTSGPQAAAVIAGLALPFVAQPLDWRLAFAVPAALAVASLIALVRRGLEPTAARAGAPRVDRRKLPRSVYVIAASAALASTAGFGLRSFLVVFAVSVGFGSSFAGYLLAFTGLLATVSRVGFGVLGDRRPGRSLHHSAALMGLCTVGFGLLIAGGDVPIIVGALLAGGIGWGWQSPLSLAAIEQDREMTPISIGIMMAGFYAGAVAGPLMVGLFAEGGHYTAAWVVCLCLATVAAGVAMVAHRLGPRTPLPGTLSKVGQT
jgi:predicted MFS family arabinose efflux permease